MSHRQILRHFGIESDESVAEMVEQMVCMDFVLRIVGPTRCFKIVFTVGICKTGTQIVRSGIIRAIAGIEIRVHAVIHAPDIGIIHKGIGYLRGAGHSKRAMLHPVESFAEALTAPIVFSCQTVDGEYEGIHVVGKTGKISVAVGRLAPAGFTAVIAVLEDEASGIDSGIYTGSVAGPRQCGQIRRDITQSGRTKIIYYHISVWIRRPAAARCARINRILANRLLVVNHCHVAVNYFGADCEPPLSLPAACH